MIGCESQIKMKKKILFLNFITFVVFLFFSGNKAFSARIMSFPLNKVKQLEVLFKELRIDTRRLKPDELRFLEDSMDENPTMMLYNEDVGRAVINPSSYAELVYQKVFFTRLNPHDPREISSLFQHLFGHQHEIFEKLTKRRELPRKHAVSAWKRVVHGTVHAIRRGDFKISLGDLHAFYINFLDETIGDGKFNLTEYAKEYSKKGYYTLKGNESIPVIGAGPDLIEEREKAGAIMVMFWDFAQATTKIKPPSAGDPVLATLRIFYEVSEAGYRGDHGAGLRAMTTGLSKKEKEYLKVLDGMFSSPFYKHSQRLTSFFMMTFLRNPNLINNKGMIIRLWNSGDYRLQEVLTLRLRRAILDSARRLNIPPSTYSSMIEGNNVIIPPELREEVFRNLEETKLFQAMVEAAKENDGVRVFLESELGRLDGT